MLLRSLNWLFTLGFSILLGILAARLIWQVYLLINPPPLPTARLLSQHTTAPQKQTYDLAFLQQNPLFGHVNQAKPAPVIRPAKPTAPVRRRSNLKLVGLIGGPQGVAIIRSGQQQWVLMEGEQLKRPGPKQQLLKINADHVIISHNGQRERLNLQDRK